MKYKVVKTSVLGNKTQVAVYDKLAKAMIRRAKEMKKSPRSTVKIIKVRKGSGAQLW